jgi:hypothetical protein
MQCNAEDLYHEDWILEGVSMSGYRLEVDGPWLKRKMKLFQQVRLAGDLSNMAMNAVIISPHARAVCYKSSDWDGTNSRNIQQKSINDGIVIRNCSDAAPLELYLCFNTVVKTTKEGTEFLPLGGLQFTTILERFDLLIYSIDERTVVSMIFYHNSQ